MSRGASTVVSVDRRRDASINGDLTLFTGNSHALDAELTELLSRAQPTLVITPNVDQVLRLNRDDRAREVFEAAHLRIIDGMPLVALLRLLGCRPVHRHTGADLLPLLAGQSSSRGWTLAIVGGADGIAQRAAAELRRLYPGADVEGVGLPMLTGPEDSGGKSAVARLEEIQPDFVFLCMGFPKQESWFLHWRDHLPNGVYIGTGAAVDFAAGTVRRAPVMLQRMGMEWAFRLAQEPRRLFRRYLLEGPRFFGVAALSIRRHRMAPRPSRAAAPAEMP